MAQTTPSATVKTHGLARDYFWYLTGNIAVMVAGMISLPVTSRFLTAYDFGVLGYYETLGAVWIAVLKLGMQHSLLRFHPEHCLNRSLDEQRLFYTTFIWYPVGISLLLTTAAILVTLLLYHLKLMDTAWYMLATLVLSECAVFISFFQNLYAAERKSHLFAISNAAMRWMQLALVVPTLLYLWRSASGVLGARVVATFLVAAVIVIRLLGHVGFRVRHFSKELFRQALSLGIPLSLNEVAAMIHDQIDRVLLKLYMDLTAVGLYHINYSVASYLGMVLASSFYPAFTPYANRLYDAEGPAAYRAKVSITLRPLYYLTAALLVGVMTVGGDLLRLFIGRAKADPRVFQWVALTYIVSPMASVISHGLILEKRAKTMMYTLILSCIVNVAANMLLIPRFGIMGATYATVISFSALLAMRVALTSKETRPIGPLQDYLRPAGMGLLLYFAVTAADRTVGQPVVRLFIAAVLFVVAFIVPSFVIDRGLREQAWRKLPRNIRRRFLAA